MKLWEAILLVLATAAIVIILNFRDFGKGPKQDDSTIDTLREVHLTEGEDVFCHFDAPPQRGYAVVGSNLKEGYCHAIPEARGIRNVIGYVQ